MEKWLIAYSSATGNTKRVAQAMQEGLAQVALCAVHEAAPLAAYDAVAVGFWVRRGGPNEEAAAYLRRIEGKPVVLFQTLGAEENGEHAMTSLARAAALLGPNCEVVGTFSCRGRIHPALLAKREALPPDDPHHPNVRNRARWAAAAPHPDAADLKRAQQFMHTMAQRLARITVRKCETGKSGDDAPAR